MLTIFLIYFFLLGLIIGSFLNVVILRHNTGKTVSKGRSACMTCKNELTWKELIPVFSYVFQKGKCKNCKARVSIQYLLVELTTAILFSLNFYFLYYQTSSIVELLMSVGLTSCILALLVVMFVYDLKHKIIPDIFSFTAFILSIMYTTLATFVFHNNLFTIIDSKYQSMQLFGGIIFYVVIYLLWKISKGRLIGLGDAKLLLSLGTILGLVYGLSSIFLGVWIGCLFVIALMLKQRLNTKGKHITMKSEIPFGPFLIIGFLIVYFSKIDVTNLSFILENFS